MGKSEQTLFSMATLQQLPSDVDIMPERQVLVSDFGLRHVFA